MDRAYVIPALFQHEDSCTILLPRDFARNVLATHSDSESEKIQRSNPDGFVFCLRAVLLVVL